MLVLSESIEDEYGYNWIYVKSLDTFCLSFFLGNIPNGLFHIPSSPSKWKEPLTAYLGCRAKKIRMLPHKNVGWGFQSPQFMLRHGTVFQRYPVINSQYCHEYACDCTILQCSETAPCELLQNWHSACGTLLLFSTSHGTIQYTHCHTGSPCDCMTMRDAMLFELFTKIFTCILRP